MRTGCECDETKQVRYRWRLTVQSPGGTPDAFGQVDLDDPGNWNTEGTIKGNFVSKGGREFYRGEQIQADVTDIIETPSNRFSRGIQPDWRIVFQGEVYQILAAFDVNHERKIVQIQTKKAV